jgi:hypothetical protein
MVRDAPGRRVQAGMRLAYSSCRRRQPSQNGAGALPDARATSTSRCMCQPAPIISRLRWSEMPRWTSVSSTSSPARSSSISTLPVSPQVKASRCGGSNAVTVLRMRFSSPKPSGLSPGGSVSSSLRHTSSNVLPSPPDMSPAASHRRRRSLSAM